MQKQSQHVLGVIGGMGPIPTAWLLDMMIQMTDAACDQEHLDMILYNYPSIPDRTRYILDNTQENPLPVIARIGKALADQGAGYLAIPCVTSHYFYDQLQSQIPIPIIHAIRETASHLKENGITCAGIMATDGTIRSRIFHRELEAQGITALHPSAQRQADVMHIIYENVKAGKPLDMDRFQAVNAELRESGAQAVILGCTELSSARRNYPIGPGFLDVLEVLAQRSVVLCGAPLKPEYACLITK